jgi:NAD+ kinase
MKILLVYKNSNYEIHGQRVEQFVQSGRLGRAALDALLFAHNEHYTSLDLLRKKLQQANVEVIEATRQSDDLMLSSAIDMVLTFGGDGTLLFTAQQIANAELPVIGVRSTTESVGYLCAYDLNDLDRCVSELVSNQVRTQKVERLCAQLSRADCGSTETTAPVLNDFLYTHANPAQTTRYRIEFGRWTEIQRSSGLWVATAIGSTAAIHAAGGVIQPRSSQLFQYRARELFRPQTHRRELEGALFDPAEQDLCIENYAESAILALDGQHASYELSYGDRIRFVRAPALTVAARSL